MLDTSQCAARCAMVRYTTYVLCWAYALRLTVRHACCRRLYCTRQASRADGGRGKPAPAGSVSEKGVYSLTPAVRKPVTMPRTFRSALGLAAQCPVQVQYCSSIACAMIQHWSAAELYRARQCCRRGGGSPPTCMVAQSYSTRRRTSRRALVVHCMQRRGNPCAPKTCSYQLLHNSLEAL